MTVVRLGDTYNLVSLVQILDEEKEDNAIDRLLLSIEPGAFFDGKEKWYQLLWSVLSHPYSKIKEIRISEWGDPDFLVLFEVTKLVKEWCTKVPTSSSRKISLELNCRSTDRSRKVFDDLREALTHPNNHVDKLTLDEFGGLCPGELLLGPVLENPNNKLQKLYMGRCAGPFHENDIVTLSRSFQSPHCKLKEVDMSFCGVTLTGAARILEGLRTIHTLEHIGFWETGTLSFTERDERQKLFMVRLGHWLESPFNRLRSLSWKMPVFSHSDATILAKAITNEHCRLEEFDCDWVEGPENVGVSLFTALRNPNCRLRRLTGSFRGTDSVIALAESLKDPNCRLEALSMGEDSRVSADARFGKAIAEALISAPASRLKSLRLGELSEDILLAFAESLLSPRNILTNLSSYYGASASIPENLRGSVRRSNLLCISGFETKAFEEAFNQPFVQVLYTLLSVKFVPRLAQSAWSRLLPVQDLILAFAKTLGWPLKDLCTRVSEPRPDHAQQS